jgi:uncharacterized membrane protein
VNGAHIHLLLNHAPVVLTPTAMVVLGIGLLRRRADLQRFGLGLLMAAAVLAAPAYLTGDPAEAVVRPLPGVSGEAIERHEDMATEAIAIVGLAGVAALFALILDSRRGHAPRWLLLTAMGLSVAGSAWLALTANLGGHIRHPEIRASIRALE